ncbi:MAG: cofactor-independent phosphoglycerate mutase [Deltaproteobacteria bacterium]|nr:cofactor-independent phosphoglycerate mutase [Deltaproteobacteria bacterium]
MTGHHGSGPKYALLVGDGMADYPLAQLDGKTPLEVAHTPNMDRIAACRVGLVNTVPPGMAPGSDVANLSLLGYDPALCRTGRAPFEAASMGIALGKRDVAFRMNLVTLDPRSGREIVMVSHNAGDISTQEGRAIVETLKRDLVLSGVRIHAGVAYRHLMVWEDGPVMAKTIPPHDVLDQNMTSYLNPEERDPVVDVIRLSWNLLKEHPINIERMKKGLKAANSVWLWGQGRALEIPLFRDRFGLKGGVISAVDLLKGIGVYAGFKSIAVEGATGYLDTNYSGKAQEALTALTDLDFIFVHVEAPDEASHSGDVGDKIQAIESFDEKVVGAVMRGLEQFTEYRIMVASDHFTPISIKTHASDPAPFAWADKGELASGKKGVPFTEASAKASGLQFEKGYDLMPSFLGQA